MIGKFLKLFSVLIVGSLIGVYVMETDNLISRNVASFTDKKEDIITVEASGRTEFFLEDGEYHHIDPETFGTPDSPLGVDLLPLWVRTVSEDGTEYRSSLDSQNFSPPESRVEVVGTLKARAQNLSPITDPNSKDIAELEANFGGPNGENFKVVLTDLLIVASSTPASNEKFFWGGVSENQVPQYSNGFSYVTIRGIADVYRDGEVVDEDRIASLTSSLNAKGDMVLHLVLSSLAVNENNEIVHDNMKTGVFSEDGQEQNFLHINYYENIKITGNKFLDQK